MERAKLRKILYIYSTIISLVLVIILTYNFLQNMKAISEKDKEILYNNSIQLKKTYIKDIVNEVIQQIDIDRKSIINEFENNIDNVMEIVEFYMKKDSFSLTYIDKEKCDKEFKIIIWNKGENKVEYVSKGISLDKPINSQEDFIQNIKKFKVNRYKSIPNKIIAVVITEETIENKVKNRIKEYIRNTNLSDNGYIWVNQIINYNGGNNFGIRLVHPNLIETEGQMLSTNERDPKGKLIYLEELEGVKKNGEIFFDYYFKKKNSDIISHKISYAKLYPKYNWIIATGVHLDDIDNMIKGNVEKLQNNLKNQIIDAIGITIFLSLILIIIIFIFEKRYYTIINEYYNSMIRENNKLIDEKLRVEEEFKRLESIAITDALTSLYNRRFISEHLQKQFLKVKKEKYNSCVALGDVDHFKEINDTYGHEAGDYVLKSLSKILKSNMRKVDRVARWGGEEFLIIFADIKEEDAIKIIKRIMENIEKQPINYKGKMIKVTLSFGVSSFLKTDERQEEVLLRADNALYKSKKNGRNKVSLYKNKTKL